MHADLMFIPSNTRARAHTHTQTCTQLHIDMYKYTHTLAHTYTHRISVQRVPVTLPKPHGTAPKELFVIDKPASVPAHPCGPYIANSLTTMVEAQEGLEPLSLAPCHRLDKHTSGVLLAATDADVSRWVQSAMQVGACLCK